MSVSDVDLRGFDYPLAPLITRHRWTLEQLQARVARAQIAWRTLAERLQKSEDDLRDQEDYMRGNAQRTLDPAAHRRMLDYLLHMQSVIAGQKKEVRDAHALQKELLTQCMHQQTRIDMLEANRLQQLQQYVMTETARRAVELDHAWVARSLWQAQASEGDVS